MKTIAHPSDDRHSDPTPVFEWIRALRGCGLPACVIGTLLMLCTYGDPDGRNNFPGEVRLAAALGLSTRTIRRHLDTARAAGWIVRDETSGPRSRARGDADAYMLTVPFAHVAAAIDEAASTGHGHPVDDDPESAGAPDSGDESTGQRRPEAPDTTVRPPIQVPTQRPASARAALRTAVVKALTGATGRGCDEGHADAVIRDVLGDRAVARPAAYLRAAIQRNPRRYAPVQVPARFVRESVTA